MSEIKKKTSRLIFMIFLFMLFLLGSNVNAVSLPIIDVQELVGNQNKDLYCRAKGQPFHSNAATDPIAGHVAFIEAQVKLQVQRYSWEVVGKDASGVDIWDLVPDPTWTGPFLYYKAPENVPIKNYFSSGGTGTLSVRIWKYNN